nr:MAG TPA: hypothetical protein [Inoviridae sp.]
MRAQRAWFPSCGPAVAGRPRGIRCAARESPGPWRTGPERH